MLSLVVVVVKLNHSPQRPATPTRMSGRGSLGRLLDEACRIARTSLHAAQTTNKGGHADQSLVSRAAIGGSRADRREQGGSDIDVLVFFYLHGPPFVQRRLYYSASFVITSSRETRSKEASGNANTDLVGIFS